MNGRKIGKYAMWLTLVFVAAIFLYREWGKSNSTTLSNPFQEYANKDAKNGMPHSDTLLILEKKSYAFKNLPKDVQVELFREEQRYHDRQKIILKDFAARFYGAKQSDPAITVNEVPTLVSFLKMDTSPEEYARLFEIEKSKLPAGTPEQDIKNQVRFELLSRAALNFYDVFLKKLYSEGNLQIMVEKTVIPDEWLQRDNFPKLGSPNAKNHLIILANYVCDACKRLNEEVANLYTKYGPEQLEITFIPFGEFSGAEDYLSRASMCVFQQDTDLFWKFHIDLVNEMKKNPPLQNKKDVGRMNQLAQDLSSKLDLNKSKFQTCLSDNNAQLKRVFAQIKSDFRFLDVLDLPIFILNNSKLDVEGRTLVSAFEENIK